jgi:hypothetical protein
MPIGIARLPSGSRSLRAINTDPLFAVALLRRQAAAPVERRDYARRPQARLRAFGFGHYLSCISELVSGVAGNIDFENSVGATAPTQNQSPGAPSTELARRDHTLLRTRAKVNP